MRRIRLRPNVRYRQDDFGGICYVPHRDDFFALTAHAFSVLRSLPRQFELLPDVPDEALTPFLRLGIAQAEGEANLEQAFSGPSFIGHFPELPTVTAPLVINCFTTAWCPLLCKYCHADDLMTREDRAREQDDFVDNVIATAQAIPALVAVITGGDPITRPERALRLIKGLAPSKALVLDTSGVGDIEPLLPALKQYSVHVRVSLDSALRSVNDGLRPINIVVTREKVSCWDSARAVLRRLIGAEVSVSVQTVITSTNDRIEEWRLLRDQLIALGVKHWVLHLLVAGGKARAIEKSAAGQRRPRSIRPASDVGKRLAAFVHETIDLKVPIDVRCTDTDDRPNSVLLVASNGDLYTEGFAKKGKVRLFEAGAGRPDRVQALMAHLDRFGHARRYLNWNPWFTSDEESLEDVCVSFPDPRGEESAAVETEFKLRIRDVGRVTAMLTERGFVSSGTVFQRDEYFDTDSQFAAQNDYVIRLRAAGDRKIEAAFKGPRFFTGDDASSRLEFEVPTTSLAEARAALSARGLRLTWFLEKRRTDLRHDGLGVKASIDELPKLGTFLELEGQLPAIRGLIRESIGPLGAVERRNYKELAVDELTTLEEGEIKGLAFD